MHFPRLQVEELSVILRMETNNGQFDIGFWVVDVCTFLCFYNRSKLFRCLRYMILFKTLNTTYFNILCIHTDQ